MTRLQRRILKIIAAVLVVMILFPPIRSGYAIWRSGGYAFLFDLPFQSSINVALLLVEWLFAIAIGGIAFLLAKDNEPASESVTKLTTADSGRKPPSTDTPPQPQLCARCHAVNATRLVLFRSNVSYLFGRRERQVCDYLCLPCMSRYFLRFEAVTLIGTWWGLLGLAIGPGYLISNLIEYTKNAIALALRRRT